MSNPKTLTFTLDEPVKFQDETYSALTFRRMKAKDLIAGDAVKGDMRKSFALFASMAGVPIQVIEEMDGDDFMRMGMEVAPLMGKAGKDAAAAIKGKAPEATD